MPQLTAEEALQIGNVFAGFAKLTEDYRFAHAAELSETDMATLRERENAFLKTSNDYLDQGMNKILDDGAGNAEALGKIGDLLKQDQAKLDSINEALEFTKDLADLATGFATGNPETIASSLQAVFSELKESSSDKTKSAT
jgi:hypothetical protein